MAQTTTNRASSLDRLSKALNPKGKPTDEHVWGTVVSVNADGSYQVRISASNDTTRCAACCSANAGDRVLVTIMADGKCAAVGRLGGEIAGPEGIVQETDPTVPTWAKQPNPPTYTAEDVGALPDDTVIPTEIPVSWIETL